jgi:hypothetical protein
MKRDIPANLRGPWLVFCRCHAAAKLRLNDRPDPRASRLLS